MNLVSFSFIPPAGLPERRNIGSLEDTMKKNYLSNIFLATDFGHNIG
jgi:hypothetical protein